MQACRVGFQAPQATKPLRGGVQHRGAQRAKVVASVAAPNSSSPLLEGLVAEGIITADEAVSCSPEQLEQLIRTRFRPETSAERASIQAYVSDGIITQEELERCSPEQLEFLIRKRTPEFGGPEAEQTQNVVPFTPASPKASPDLKKEAAEAKREQPAPRPAAAQQQAPPRAAAAQAKPVNGAGAKQANDAGTGDVEAYLATGILTPEEVEKCSPQQLEFLVRKRSPSPPASRGAPRAARTPPTRAASPAAPPRPEAVKPAQAKSPQKEEPEFVQLSLEEYLAQGVVSEYEIINCSPQQLEFLIRKRLTLASAAAVAESPSPPARGRSREPRRPSAAAAEPAAQEAPRQLVVPRAPPLTDAGQARATNPFTRPVAAEQEDGSAPWAGMAVAGLTVVGLSAGLYFATPRNEPPATEPAALQQPARAGRATLEEKPSSSKAELAPKADSKADSKVATTNAAAATKAESKTEAPKADEKKAAPAAAAALKTDTKPVVPAVPKQEEKKEQAAAAAAAQQKAAEPKTASKVMAERLAAELAAELADKQQPKSAAAGEGSKGSGGQGRVSSAASLGLAAAGASLAALLVPGAREALFGRFTGEAAVLKSATNKCASLQKTVEAQQGDLRLLQDQLGVAQAEYGQALAKLNGAKGALESLNNRVQSSEKAAKALVAELDRLPSKEAQKLKGEAASVAAAVASQRAAVERALQKALKDL